MLNLRYSENAGLNKTPVKIHLLAPFTLLNVLLENLVTHVAPVLFPLGRVALGRVLPFSTAFLPTPRPQSSSGALWIIFIGSSLPELPVAHPGLWPSAW